MTSRGRIAVAAFALLALAVFAWVPLQGLGARIIVDAPNRGMPEPAPRPGEVRVAVGPPAASIALEILEVPSPRGTVFVLHGIRAAKEWIRGWGEMLNHAGFRAVMVDLRGHGRSTGDVMSYGAVEAHDLRQVLDALEVQGKVSGRVGVMGVSYGGSTAIAWAGADPRVAAVVAVAPFASLRDVVPDYLPIPLPRSFADACVERAARRGNFDPDLGSPITAIGATRAPVLLIHGLADARIRASHSERMAAVAPNRTELHLVPGAGHESIVGDPTGIIRTRAPAWFTAHVAAAGERAGLPREEAEVPSAEHGDPRSALMPP